jgi:hypothetical protein
MSFVLYCLKPDLPIKGLKGASAIQDKLRFEREKAEVGYEKGQHWL